MIYLEEKMNLIPASPETLDIFIKMAQEQLIPICERLGSRLVAAWYSDVEWFSQVTQIMEFDDMEALKAFRIKTSQDLTWGKYMARLEELAPERSSRLLEPLGPVQPKVLNKAIRRSQKKPLGVYSLATLEVAPNKMPEFMIALEQASKGFPIIASWRPIAGNPNEVIDLWKGALRQASYQPADEFSLQFFRPLRELAPKERLIKVYTLPYSQLR
ncbi:MAG: NIPSNAP family protein [Promethearchaeota archaeon]